MGYAKIAKRIDWQAEKRGVPVLVIGARGTSSECPRCNNRKMKEVEYGIL